MNPEMANEAVTQEADAGSHESQPQTNQAADQNWKAVREELSSYKTKINNLEQQNQHLQSAYQNANQPQQPQQSDDDIMTVGEFRRALAEKEAVIQQQLAETRTRSMYSDYNDVVNEDNFRQLKEQYPGLGDAIMTSKNPNLLAYAIGRSSDSYQQRSAQKQESVQNAEQIMANAQKPGSISNSMTGGSTISRAEQYAGMSDQEFEQKVVSVKRSGNWTY